MQVDLYLPVEALVVEAPARLVLGWRPRLSMNWAGRFPGSLADPPRRHHRTSTGVPFADQKYSHSASGVRMLTQPWLTGSPKLLCQ